MENVPQWIEIAGLVIAGIVLLATVLVRVAEVMVSIAPNSLDPAHIVKAKSIVNRAGEILAKAMQHFPTLFKNPKTQQMEKLIEQLQAEKAGDSSPVEPTKADDDKAS